MQIGCQLLSDFIREGAAGVAVRGNDDLIRSDFRGRFGNFGYDVIVGSDRDLSGEISETDFGPGSARQFVSGVFDDDLSSR